MRQKLFFIIGLLVTISTAAADSVTLTTGEVLEGEITSHDAEVLVLRHPVLGELKIPSDKVVEPSLAVERAEVEAEAKPAKVTDVPRAVAEAAEKTIEKTVDPRWGLLAGWDSQFDVGLNGAEGNNDNASLYLALLSKRENDEGRWKFDTSYRYGQSKGKTNANKFTVGLVRDWYLSDDLWFYFADVRYDWDQFQDWQSRLAGHAGVGYKLITEEDLTVEVRGGIGAVREFGSTDDSIKPEALAGAELQWKINEHQSLNAASTFYPDLEDGGEFRAVSNADWKLNLAGYESAAIKIGVKHEHQSLVDPGTEKDDFWYYAALSIGF